MTSAAFTAREPDEVRLGRNIHVNLLLLAQQNRAAMESICQEEGLTEPQYAALWTLCLVDPDGVGMPIGSVTDGLINPAADTTRLVDRLARAGLAERLPNPDDRRSVLVRATDRGRRAFAVVTPNLQAWHRTQWSALSPDEQADLNRLLAKALWPDGPPSN
ncbi:MAG: MarR family winged helix-turn-helix transcriptional regulator [Acidimicrobiales bacterium]